MQPLAGPFRADPPQALIDAQLAHMIESPELDDFEEVAQQLPLIRAELGDQQALLSACNEFLEEMASRHLTLLMQQQATTARSADSRPNTPTAAGAQEALSTLQAYGQLEQQLQEADELLEGVSAQLELQRQQAEELLQQKEALNKQLRIVTMEREELKEQLLQGAAAAATEESADSSAQLQDALAQLSEAQERLTAAEAKLDEALDSNTQLTTQLQQANSAAEVAKATALAATASASAETHAQLQEASARAATLEAELLASQQYSAAVADSNTFLQQQLREAHAQGGRLISMNRQLMQHAELLEGRVHEQASLVSALKEDKAAMAAELGRIYVMLQDMAGAQQRQQQLQQQLLQIISQQRLGASPGPAADSKDGSAAAAAVASAQGDSEAEGNVCKAAGSGQEDSAGLVKALSGALLGGVLPLLGQFTRS